MKILFIQTNYPGFLNKFYSSLKDKKLDPEELKYNQIKQLWAKELFGSSNFYLSNLEKLGWNGDEIIANDIFSQSAWAKDAGFQIKIGQNSILNRLPGRIRNILNLDTKAKNIVFKQIDSLNPDVVYVHDVTYFSISELKEIKKMTKLLVGQIAYPKPINLNVLKSYDLLVSSLPNFVSDFKKIGIKSEYLKWCFEKKILNTVKPNKHKKYDAVYVGGFSPHHSKGNQVLEKISKNIHIDFWGYGKNFLPINSNIKKTYHGEAWGKEMYEVFAQSKIVINRHINLAKNYANNMRMFEATGMGALLITDKKKNLHDFFLDGKEIVAYKNSKDLEEKIKYYLKNDTERVRIAKAGQKRTLKDHSYETRMKDLDKILKKYLKT